MSQTESIADTATTTTTTIYKILTTEEWAAFQHSGVFRGNPLDLQDGYIHMSYQEQVDKTVQKFFSGRESEIRLVHVDTTLLHQGELRPESNKPGGDVYPHIYGTIPIQTVLRTTHINSSDES